MQKLLLTLIILTFFLRAEAQEKVIPLSISVFNNGTMLPGEGHLGVFSKTIHPGIALGTNHLYGSGKHHYLFQTLKLGYFYHHYSQHAIQLYSELGYGYKIVPGISIAALLGIGYLHSFSDVQQFSFKNGEYVQKTNWGRAQLMGSFSLQLGYGLEKLLHQPIGIFLQYQFWIQAPFVNKYVPILPNNAVHLGVHFPLKLKRNKVNGE